MPLSSDIIGHDWQTIATAINVTEETSAAGSLYSPVLIVRAAQRFFVPDARCKSVLFRCGYDDADTSITGPDIICWGLTGDAGAAEFFLLKDINDNTSFTLTVDTSTDLHDGTLKYTAAKEIFMEDATKVLFAVKTAYIGTGSPGSAVIVAKQVIRS